MFYPGICRSPDEIFIMNGNPNFFSQFLRYFASDSASRERFELCITIILRCTQKRCQCVKIEYFDSPHKLLLSYKFFNDTFVSFKKLGWPWLEALDVLNCISPPSQANLYRLWLPESFQVPIFERPCRWLTNWH